MLILSKIFEKVIEGQTREFTDGENIIYKFQSGFRKGFSTDTCLSYLHDKIAVGFEKGYHTGMILIDLQKAFDTIDHTILLKKLKYMRFSNNVILWFKSYLSNRTFKVKIDRDLSDEETVKCGVPQGSILGPLLFLLYVNDMKQALDCDLLLYADDSCLIFQHKNVKEVENVLNRNFSNLCEWFVDNKLSLHYGDDKTKSILFSSKMKAKNADPLNINYRGTSIKQHTSVKYLGCLLNQTLSGETMATYVLNKINSKLKFLYRKRSFLTPTLKRSLCNALIQPHFDYACSAWYLGLNESFKMRLKSAQNKCIRFCLNLHNRDHIGTEQYKAINWLPVDMRVNQCIASQAFKFCSKPNQNYMSDIFKITENRRINLRNSHLRLDAPLRRSNMGKNCLSSKGPFIWNNLPEDIKTITSHNTFKHKIKETFLNSLDVIRRPNIFRL